MLLNLIQPVTDQVSLCVRISVFDVVSCFEDVRKTETCCDRTHPKLEIIKRLKKIETSHKISQIYGVG